MSASLPVAILWQATLNILQSARQSVTCHMWHLITVFISNCLQQYYTDKVISVVVTRYVAPDILLSHANLVNVIPAPCPWSRSRLLLLTNINTPVSPWSPVTTNTTKEEQRENEFLPRTDQLSIIWLWRGIRSSQWPVCHQFTVSRSVHYAHTKGTKTDTNALFIIHIKLLFEAASQNNAGVYDKLGSRNKSKVWLRGFCEKQRGNAQGRVYKILSGNVFSPPTGLRYFKVL